MKKYHGQFRIGGNCGWDLNAGYRTTRKEAISTYSKCIEFYHTFKNLAPCLRFYLPKKGIYYFDGLICSPCTGE